MIHNLTLAPRPCAGCILGAIVLAGVLAAHAQLPEHEVLFKFAPGSGGLPVNGNSPNTLTLAPDGIFYGTCGFGGTWNQGTVFKMTANGTLTTLVSFNGTNGGVPFTSVGPTLGPDGNYYGTTSRGGTNGGGGTVFKMTPDGLLTSLVVFRGTNGSQPYGKLIPGGDGNLYGTTTAGMNNSGTVFKVSTNGTLTALASFRGTNGATPWAGLALGPDGNFYGTTTEGGRGNGTVFKMTPTGTLTTLASLASSNGTAPRAGLTLGDDGNFYGTTYQGGAVNAGTVFKVTTNGILTTLVSFRGTNGANPESRLLLGLDGNFYGTTDNGGARSLGTVFMMTTSGVLTTLVSFAGTNGTYPNAGLTLGDDGHLYGTTQSGGIGGLGTVFRLKTGFQKGPSIVAQPVAQQIFTGFNATFTVSATTTNPPLRYQWVFNGADLPGATNDTLTISNAQVANLGSYQAVVTDSVRSVRSALVSLSFFDAILITTQPAHVVTKAGSNATFTIVATGVEPLHYLWLHDGILLPGATNSVLTLTNVQATHLGDYSVLITNDYGYSSGSRVATLTFFMLPTIVESPQAQSVVAGDNVTFTVTVTNTATLPVSYRWRRNSTTLTNMVLNSRTASFTLFNVSTNISSTNGPGNYDVIVTNIVTVGFGARGGPVSLAVLPAPAPAATTLAASNTATTGATLNASVNPMGAQTVAWFDYGLTPAYGSSSTALPVGNASNLVAFSQPVTGLLTGTNYHYRIVATNHGGMALGEDLVFQTSGLVVPPVISAYELPGDGHFRLWFDSAPGTTNSVLVSTNLSDWNPLGHAAELTPGHFEFTDADASGHPTRFYQLRTP